MTNHYEDYASAAEWLEEVRQDDAWLSQLQRIQNSTSDELKKLRKETLKNLEDKTTNWFWDCHKGKANRVERVVTELWDCGISMPRLKMRAISMMTLEQMEQQDKTAPGTSPNYSAPTINLQRLLRGTWFKELCTNDEYDETWTDAFVSALMNQEWRDDIARDWAVAGAREKKTQLKGYIIGLLKDAGVLKGSYDAISDRLGITKEPRTFSRYMGEGKKQPYSAWVKDYVNGITTP